MPMSGPCSRRNAFSSVTSSPMNTVAEAPSWCRRMSSACPLSVWMTANSKTALPSVICASQCCEAACAFFSASLASAGSALRTCSATLAGLISIATPGNSAAIALKRVLDPAQQRLGRIVDRVHEAGVELGTVAADQMDLGGHPRQRRQVAQRPARRSAPPSSTAGRPARAAPPLTRRAGARRRGSRRSGPWCRRSRRPPAAAARARRCRARASVQAVAIR